MGWRTFILIVLLVTLCVLLIPIKIDNLKFIENQRLFESYVQLFNRSYLINSTEYQLRFENFQKSMEESELLNEHRNHPNLAFYGFTKFSDISDDEFKIKYLKRKSDRNRDQHHHHHHNHHQPVNNQTDDQLSLLHPSIKLLRLKSPAIDDNTSNKIIINDLPKSIDWRKKGIVSAVKNQKTCGACWAFSTISNVESMAALRYGKLQELSVQEVIDCAGNGNLGCNGGDTCSLLDWLIEFNIPIIPADKYPLTLRNDYCKIKSKNLINTNVIYDNIYIKSNFLCKSFANRENDLLKIIADHGPVTVAVNAITWQYYLGGIIKYHCDNTIDDLNHAVVIVGYDVSSEIPYYIVKNSWGTDFGENGYLKIAVGNNVCGIVNEVAIFDVV